MKCYYAAKPPSADVLKSIIKRVRRDSATIREVILRETARVLESPLYFTSRASFEFRPHTLKMFLLRTIAIHHPRRRRLTRRIAVKEIAEMLRRRI